MNAHNIEQHGAASQLSTSDCLGDVLGRQLRKQPESPGTIRLANPSSSAGNQFRRMWELGYRRLLPVVPPDAPIRSAGKRPGLVIDGRWVGRGRKDFNATEDDLDAWHAMGAGVGLLCDADAVGVDIDTLSPEWSTRILAIANEELGILPRRIGLAPKTLLMARCEEGARYRQIRFADGSAPIERNGKIRPAVGLVELLAGDTCYFNVLALHPKTGKPYALPDGLPPYDQLPRVTRAQLDGFFERLAAELPTVASSSASSVDRTKIDQDGLKGDHDFLAEALAVLPNEPAAIGYDEWVRIAAACRGAFQDDYGLGLELFEEWSDKADIADPSETAARVYGSIEAPFGVGAGYIFDQARASGWVAGWQRTVASTWFDPDIAESQPSPFSDRANGVDFRALTAVSIDDLTNIPSKEFVLGTRFQPGALTVGVGPGGVSKSMFAMMSAVCIASGRALTGELVSKRGPVLVYDAETPIDEIRRRLKALAARHNVPLSDVVANVRLLSGHDRRLIIAERRDRNGPIIVGRDVAALQAFISDAGIVHIVLDPLVSLHRGLDENSSGDMDRVTDILRDIASKTRASIDLIHHAVKNRTGQPEANAGVADAARGSGAIIMTSRAAYTLTAMSAKTGSEFGLEAERVAQMVRIDDAKRNNTRRSARERWFEIQSVLPDGTIVPGWHFEAADLDLRKRALESVGVHIPFDAHQQRTILALNQMDNAEHRRTGLLSFIVGAMPADVVNRTHIVGALMTARGISETSARMEIDAAVPEGRGKAVDAEGSEVRFRVWRERAKHGRQRPWLMYREPIGQVVRDVTPQEASDGRIDPQNGGIFE
ncbi:MAG: AAA family ATPase [Tardiphaga sp.]